MNMAMWIVAGGALGWLGFSLMRINGARGPVMAVIIGAVGGLIGGNLVAPILGAATHAPNEFNMFSMLVALGTAAACLAVGNELSERFGI